MSSPAGRPILTSVLPQDRPKSFQYYDILSSAFVAVLLVSNIVAPKFIALGPLKFSGAQILFPITYIFGDIFTEVYGYAASRRVIWNGFFASILLAAISYIVVKMPPGPGWNNQAAYETVLGVVPRAVFASLVAYWAGEFANSFTLARMKVLTRGKYLWTRTVGSTVVGQAVDTMLVIFIIFVGTMPLSNMLEMMVDGYIFKVLYEAAATPLTYLVVNTLKRLEGVDVMDENTNFNPFAVTPVT